MNTLKSAFAVALMAVVLYGVYIALNQPETRPSKDLSELIDSSELDLPEVSRSSTSSRKPANTESRPSVYEDDASYDEMAAADNEIEQASYSGADTEEAELEATLRSQESKRTFSADPFSKSRKSQPTEEVEDEEPLAPPKAKSVSPEQARAEVEEAKARRQRYAFDQAFQAAKAKVDANECREALIALSAFYGDPRLSSEQQHSLHEWLDALAGKVIYSTEHWLAPAHEVRTGETLFTVSEKYNVPYLLLKKINSIRDPEVLVPGTRLKVVPGPFRAEVDTQSGEVTLFLGAMYAGRFVFTLGDEPAAPGKYAVVDKQTQRAYYTAEGSLPPKDPKNPYGGVWIDLGRGVSIHGSAVEPTEKTLGCIGLAPRDAEDIYAILSLNSQVIVR